MWKNRRRFSTPSTSGSAHWVDRFTYSELVPDVLYHYTSWEGFAGIVGSQEFWATDHRDMDDKGECKAAEPSIDVVLREMTASATGPAAEVMALVAESYPRRRAADWLTLYLTCFSFGRDKAYFWQKHRRDVCIGITIHDGEKLPEVPWAQLGRAGLKVGYSSAACEQKLRSGFLAILEEYEKFLPKAAPWGSRGPRKTRPWVPWIASQR